MNVAKELRKLSQEPLEGIKVQLNEEDVTDVCAEITGPGTPPSPVPIAEAARASPQRLFLETVPSPLRSPKPSFPPLARRLDALRGCGVQGEAGLAGGVPARAAQGYAPTPAPATPVAHPFFGCAVWDSVTQSGLPVFAPGFFLTKIFHPNISKTGDICVNTLKKDWKSDLGLDHVLQARTLLRRKRVHSARLVTMAGAARKGHP